MHRFKILTICALALALLLAVPAYGADTLDALAAYKGCTADTLLDGDVLAAGDSVSDWIAVAAGRSRSPKGESRYLRALEDYVTQMYRTEGGLHRLKATEWHRIALAVLAQGGDPTAFGTDAEGKSVNLIADGVYAFTAADSLGKQGLNGWIFALITLDSGRFAVPEGARYTRSDILQALAAAQNGDGSFGLTVGSSDVDITAMALQALAPYQNGTALYVNAQGQSVTVGTMVSSALEWLSQQQTAEGDFVSWGAANPESTAQVLIALCALGIDPAEDARFIRSGNALDGLLRYRLPDGTFCHTLQAQTDLMATEQAALALEAVARVRSGQRSLYDFREPMSAELQQEITQLNQAIRSASAQPQTQSQAQLQALYDRYCTLPAAERSYVYTVGALQTLGIDFAPEDPAQAYNLRQAAQPQASDTGAVIWIAAGLVAAAAVGCVIFSRRRKVCTK